jgi:hypothetical protein
MTFLRRIAAVVAYHYEIEPDEIFGLRKAAEIAEARHMVMWLACRHAPPAVSQSRIAQAMRRDPSTISNSKLTAQAMIDAGGHFATIALRLDEYFRKVGIDKAARITAAINAEAEAVEPVSHFLAEQNQRFVRAVTEAA